MKKGMRYNKVLHIHRHLKRREKEREKIGNVTVEETNIIYLYADWKDILIQQEEYWTIRENVVALLEEIHVL